MLSIYQAYQAYERRANRGEFEELPGDHKIVKPLQTTFSYRLGDLLVRAGTKLIQKTQAGHSLTAAMAGR